MLHANRPGRKMQGGQDEDEGRGGRNFASAKSRPRVWRNPREHRLLRAKTFNGDLRSLPQTFPVKAERPEREGPEPSPAFYQGDSQSAPSDQDVSGPSAPAPSAPAAAPPPTSNFDGLDFANWGAGHPPDTNGDVGPTYYIQTINTSIGIFRKTDGVRVAAFTFDTFMSQGHFGNLCDTDNFGDPVVLYDTFEDRWVITDFAFQLDGQGNVNPPHSYQCFAVSKTGDPVAGGWNYYSIETLGGLGDYPKFGIWPDGIYMSANMFDYAATGSFQAPRVFALNKAQMYSGAPTVQVITFDGPPDDFTVIPTNARLQTGTPPPGTPNYFVSTWDYLNALTVYKFHVDWDKVSLSTFSGPDVPIAATSWPNASVANAPSLGGNSLDVLQIRAMMQNQYTNIGGVESVWTTHTVRRGNTTGFAAPRWYQTIVTGGTVAPNIAQATTWDPDGANVIYRFMPSLAVNKVGDMALGYSTSSSSTKPAIKYAGRLSTDPINTFSQTEQLLVQGTGTQVGNCGSSACIRWGDYSAMTLDPDGCTFWYTNEYYAADGLNHQTRIGSFQFPTCTDTTIQSGTVSGTVIASSSGNPIAGATVSLGSRTTTTDGSGQYSFADLPVGTYPVISASFAGFGTQTFAGVVVANGAITTQDFALATAPTNACVTDTTQADFQSGVSNNVDVTTSPGDVILTNQPVIDQQNLSVTTSGFAVNATSWAGQTFTPATAGQLTRVDLDLFCSGCTGTTPNLTVSIRATNGTTPTGADLATATIPGFSSGAGGFFTANFASPITVTPGVRYAVILRAVSNPSAGTYAYVVSSGSPYAAGQRVTSTNSGSTWTADTTTGGRDLGFKVYLQTGFATSGDQVSSAKDANPANGPTPTWQSLSWNGSTPANTSLTFQAAASNNALGPFSFVGPDGTASTFFNNGASLAQFNGSRYLKYKAYLATSDKSVTPTLSDATVCYYNVGPPVANTDTATVDENSSNNVINVLANDVDPQNFTLTITSVTQGTHGSVAINGSAVSYTPNPNFFGSDSFTYTITNGTQSANATVNVTVNEKTVAGTITIAGSVVAKGTENGLYFLDLKLSNTGTGTAKNVQINQLTLKTLTGSGTVTSATPLPVVVGRINTGTSATVRLYLNRPSTVARFSITETGTTQNSTGASLNWTSVQSVIP